MKSGTAKTEEREERPAPPARRRFEPVMPKGYQNADQLRMELQQRIAGTPADIGKERVTPYYVDKY